MNRIDHGWAMLPSPRQRALVQLACRRARGHLASHPNVAGVGIGVRYVAGQRTEVQCVTVQVRGPKWPRSRKGALPAQVPIAVPGRAGKIRLEVPVDVVEAPHPRIQAAAGVRCVANLGGRTNPGAICCLVRTGSSPQSYALSCHHVIYFTKHFAAPAAADRQNISVDVAARRLAPTAGYFDLSRCDAALVAVPNAQPGDELVQGRELTGWADDVADIPMRCTILSPNGPPVLAQYASLSRQTIEGYYGNNTAFTFPEVLKCQFTQGMTYAGDSGSPVIDSLGRLIGMHIAGDASYSYILPTYRILISFSPVITPILRL